MQQTLTRNDTLQAVRDEREWWDAMVADTGRERMSSIRITEDWTLRDLIAHLLSWWEWRLTRLQASVNYEPKPEPPYPANLESIDEQNAWFHQQKLDRSAQDLTSAFSRSFDQLEQIVVGLSDDELADRYRTLARDYGLRGARLVVGEDEDRDLARLESMCAALQQAATAPTLIVDAGERCTPEEALRRLPGAVIAVWYPITERAPTDDLRRTLQNLAAPALYAELTIASDESQLRMKGCGLLVINPPWKLEAEARPLLDWLRQALAPDGAGSVRVDWLAPE